MQYTSIPALIVCFPCVQVRLSLKLKVKSVPFFKKRSSKVTSGEFEMPNEKRGMIPSGFDDGYHWPAVKPTDERSTVESGLLYGFQPSWLRRTPVDSSLTTVGEKTGVQPVAMPSSEKQ